MPTQPLVRIGARGSKLSRAQAGQMQRRIAEALGADPADAERVAPLVIITTTGDRVQDRRLLELGGKGLFTKEIEEALADGRIDCAVHSMKDMPVDAPPGLVIGAFLLKSRGDALGVVDVVVVAALGALWAGVIVAVIETRTEVVRVCPPEVTAARPGRPEPGRDAVITGSPAGLAWLNDVLAWAGLLEDRLADAAGQCPAQGN